MNQSPIFTLSPSSSVLDPEILRRLEPAWMVAARALPEPAWMKAVRNLPEPSARQLLGPFLKLKVISRV